MGSPNNRGYKRSWRNLLLNTRYQLRFTLVMVGLSAVLMAVLGWWVMRAAEKATTVAMDAVLGVQCKAPERPGAEPTVVIDEPIVDPEADPDPDPDPEADADPDARPPVIVNIVEEKVPPPPVSVNAVARYHLCKIQQVSTIERLYRGEWRIFLVLVVSGLALCFGLAVYGIKMTHKVAGPLHKVGLYFAKMKANKYDTVYNLRKGDQLVDFYAHFKEAHEGMRKIETEDVEMLRDLIAAADAAKVGDSSPDAAKALDELREILKTKEDAIGP